MYSRAMLIPRRSAMITGLAALAAMGLPANALARSRRSLRVCFFTDSHLPTITSHPDRLPNDKLRHQERFRAALEKANSFGPDLFLFGGDNVFAVDQDNTEENARDQFSNWRSVVKEKVKVASHSVIGNHDIWHPKGTVPPDRKALAIEAFGMPNRFYSATAGAWTFMMLDVFHEGGCKVDAEQFAWLESELRKAAGPVCIVTHAPILSVTPLNTGGGSVGGAKELRQLFLKHESVRLALSGHQHQIDRCDFDRVTYICAGAVSGAWWEGIYENFPPAFVMLNLNHDGSFTHDVVFWDA